MLKEMIKIESIIFDLSSRNLFLKVLNVINESTLWPKNLNYERQEIIVAGNIKVSNIDNIIKQSALNNRVGLYLAFPLMALNRAMYLDQLKIDVKGEVAGQSVVNIYGRLNYGSIGAPMFSKKYNVDYLSFRETILNASVPQDIDDLRAKIDQKLKAKKFLSLSWLSLLTIVTFIIVLIYMLSDFL